MTHSTPPAQSQPQASAPFVHLHVHSEYSLMDGTIRTGQLVKSAKNLGHSAVALTDSGNLFGAVEFYAKAKAEGIKAIIGSEIYFEGHPLTQKLAPADTRGGSRPGPWHLVLLCKNNQGYKNLCKIVSAGYTEGLNEVPIVKTDHLRQWPGDMIALSGDMLGELPYLVSLLRSARPSGPLVFDPAAIDMTDHEREILAAISAHIDAIHSYVGAGNYYVELIDNCLAPQKQLIKDLFALSEFFNLPTVATADAHYTDPGFSAAQCVFVAIKAGITDKELRGRNKSARFHLLSNDEFIQIYKDYPEAIANTLKIAEQCDVSFKFGTYYLPKFSLPDGMDEGSYLEKIAIEMLEERLDHLAKLYGPTFDDTRKNAYRERLKYEVSVIIKMGFPGYFLIVQDFINWAKNKGIPVGPGRGSGAGSLVAYALRITDLDPLRFNLLFERFLNPERISMPDFDVDFCQDRRGEVIDYVTEKYGKNNVAQIATFGKMKAKLAVRDVARVKEISYGRADKIAKLIPAKVPNDKGEEVEATIPLALKAEPRLVEEAEKDPTIKEILDITSQIEGLNRQTGMHAAGVVMSDGPMTDYVPVFTTEEGGLITQFEMKNAEKVGLVKFDFLGLKTLTVIDHAVKLIKKFADPAFDISSIDLEDPEVYARISEAHTTAVFQLEGDGMKQLVGKLKPSRFEDIIALVALFRPGPLGSGMVDDFVERKHGRQEISYPLPQLEGILKETYGVILYQEQVQKTAVVLANYTPGEADLLRRAMGKKIKSEMDAQKERFLKGARENNLDPEKAGQIFDLMAKFAEYGFNKSHSAAYGLIAYQTAYLKTKFPELFMAAIMTCDMDNTDKVVNYAQDCQRMRFKILPPDINQSELEFTVPAPATIRWGMAAIKGIGAAALRPLIDNRQANGPFLNLFDMARRVNLHADVGKKTMELLIKTGAMDQFGFTREHMLSIVGDVVKYSETHFAARKQGQRSLFDLNDDFTSDNNSDNHDAHPSWIGVSGKTFPVTLESLEEERKLLGIYISGHPIDFYATDVKRFSKCQLADAQKLASLNGKDKIHMVVIFQGANISLSKIDQKPRAFVTLEDRSAKMDVIMFEKDIPQAFPVPGTPVCVVGSVRKLPDGTVSRMKLERIITLEEVRAHHIKSLTLTLNLRQGATVMDPKESLRKLRSLTSHQAGPTRLRLELEYDHTSVVLVPESGIELTNQLMRGTHVLGMTCRYE